MNILSKWKNLFAALSFGVIGLSGTAKSETLHIGYSDWPGSVAWQIAIDKHWFQEQNIDVDFVWFDYGAMLDAYVAGKLDAISATNGDVLTTGANGHKSIIIMLNDYSDGNDMIIATKDVNGIPGLKGQKVAVETGLVDHLLLLTALQKYGMTEKSVDIVQTATNETPQVLESGSVAAIGVWQPAAGQALRAVSGAHPIFTSHDAPGLIYDTLAIDPLSLKRQEKDWRSIVQIWNRIVAYIEDPATQPDAIAIMAHRVGISSVTYKHFLEGTHLLNLADNNKIFEKKSGLDSLYGSTENADNFNVRYNAYKNHQNIDAYINPLSRLKPH
ncbi:ABC transporter substrate-binding protein [Acetobacter conturbans]|uniref:ABC transporter substrate-binding protein n=1 Tax=Acetobacter conturbans TaxID=1737472 RepID=A0ABX0JZI4_9PROT|nr:ABC transporter substrate-binding protein [Acetobacter conturbans]NHN87425.1 ABC transporter substrate-binding protein [Acetobacter conturbans]